MASQSSLSTTYTQRYLPLIATILPQVFAVRVQYPVLHLGPRLLQQSLALFNVLVVEIAFKLELLESEHACDPCVDIENVEDDEEDEEDGEDEVERLSEDGDDVGFSHDSRKRRVFMVDHLQKVIAQRSRYPRTIANIVSYVHGKEHEGRGIGLLVPVQSIVAGELQLEQGIIATENYVGHDHHQQDVKSDKTRQVHDATERVEKKKRRDEDAQFSYDNCSCKETEEDSEGRVQHRFYLAVP